MTASLNVTDVVSALHDWFEQFYSDIEAFGEDISQHIEFDSGHPGFLTEKSRELVKQRSVQFLSEHALPDGAGAVFSRVATGSEEGNLEWWVRDPEQGIARMTFGTNPTGDRFYEYEQLEWFERAFGKRKRAIAGPYIDYLGVDEYIVTCVTPLFAKGDAVGVVGCDIRMRDLERTLLMPLREISGDAAILNPHRNVLVGNSGRFLSGDRVPEAPAGYVITPLNVKNMELSLLHPAE